MGTINWTKDQQQIIDMRGCNILVRRPLVPVRQPC